MKINVEFNYINHTVEALKSLGTLTDILIVVEYDFIEELLIQPGAIADGVFTWYDVDEKEYTLHPNATVIGWRYPTITALEASKL
jgi:hypothetical protein